MSLYLFLILLVHLPQIQSRLGNALSETLSEKFGTKVDVGKIYLGLFNRVIVDDVKILDQDKKEMLAASRISAKLNISQLIKGNIVVTSAQLFGMKATMYKLTENSQPNYQFLIDSLKSDDEDSRKDIKLSIKSLILRHGKFKYDILSHPRTNHKINPSHLSFSDISAHIQINEINNDSIDLRVKRLSFKEQSTLNVNNLKFNLVASKKHASLSGFLLEMPYSSIKSDKIDFFYEYDENGFNTNSIRYDAILRTSQITPSDFCFVIPTEELSNPIYISFGINGTNNALFIRDLRVNSLNNSLKLISDVSISNLNKNANWNVAIKEFNISEDYQTKLLKVIQNKSIPDYLPSRIGDVSYHGNIKSINRVVSVDGLLQTGTGNADVSVNISPKSMEAHIISDRIELNKLLADNNFGIISGDVDIKLIGSLSSLHSSSISGDIDLNRFDYKGYSYNNVKIVGDYSSKIFKGLLSLNDPNGEMLFNGVLNFASREPIYDITGNLKHVDLSKIRLTDTPNNAVVSLDIYAKGEGSTLDKLIGDIVIKDLSILSPVQNFKSDIIEIKSSNAGLNHHVSFNSDFASFDVSGTYNYKSIIDSFKRLILKKIPTLSYMTSSPTLVNNSIKINADINNADFIKLFNDIPIDFSVPLHIEGFLDDKSENVNFSCISPSFIYDGKKFEDALFSIESISDTLHFNGKVKQVSKSNDYIQLILDAKASNDKMFTNLQFNAKSKHETSGNISLTTDFYEHATRRIPTIHTIIHPSEIRIDDNTYKVEPSDIVYDKGRLLIDHFAIENGKEHIIMYGLASNNPDDSININLQNINVDYLSGILNVNGVDFKGTASGTATISSILGNQKANGHLIVDNFQFSNGHLGTLFADVTWQKDNNKIQISGICDDGPIAHTNVNGYVQTSPGYIDLSIGTNNTQIDFLETYIGAFLSNIRARASGNIRVFGPLKNVNIEGQVVANGDISVAPLNVTYTLKNDTVTFYPNIITFKNNTIKDHQNGSAIINGAVYHRDLSNFTYDMNVIADKILSFDKKDFGDDTFCGTIFASGSCHVVGVKGETNININVSPEEGSIIKYNVSSPNSVKSQEFIKWNDVSDTNRKALATLITDINQNSEPQKQFSFRDMHSNLYMNFLINANPKLTLRLLMDEESGDYIDLHGNGVIQADYFNKGAFEMFGNYLVESGIYKMTIQNVIKKEFQFKPGSSIVFGGDPYNAAIDLRAVYPVNGVSLADFNIGSSFSNNNIRVNCLMNIGGTAISPVVDFDFEMPTANSNAEQMVRSLINSEEELNQQVIYLLTVGRFINQGVNNAQQDNFTQSQTGLAMQSLLSGTLSQQINEMLSSVINVNNWNFGTNISTGTEGWNNAEYEGLLSGRLLNNRLLVNGQFGYRDNPNATTSFIGDFDVRYLLSPSGSFAIKVYNQSNDRYFTKNSLNTQGIGLILKKDFNKLSDLFHLKKRIKQKNNQDSINVN